MKPKRNAFHCGCPHNSEALKNKFLPLIGKDYTSVACKRMGLPTMKIQDWLRGHNVLPADLQVKVQACIDEAAKS